MVPIFIVNFWGVFFGILLGIIFSYLCNNEKEDKTLSFVLLLVVYILCFGFYGLVTGGGFNSTDPPAGRMFDISFGFLLGAVSEILIYEIAIYVCIRKNKIRNMTCCLVYMALTAVCFLNVARDSFFVYKSEKAIPVVSNFAVISSHGGEMYISCAEPFQGPFRTKRVPEKYNESLRDALTAMGRSGSLYGHGDFDYVVASQGVYEQQSKELLYIIRDWKRARVVTLMRQIIGDKTIPFQ